MSGLAVDADQHRSLACLAFLQTGGKLERMGRNHTVVVVGRSNHRGRIFHALLQSV